MSRKTVCVIILALFFNSVLALGFNIQPVEASGTIYIRADGTLDPPTAPISSMDNVTYYFTDNINDSIAVERSDIVIDGCYHALQGSEIPDSVGIVLHNANNVTVKKMTIDRFDRRVEINCSSNIRILWNNLTGVWAKSSIWAESSTNLSIENNVVADSEVGLNFQENCSVSTVTNNNFTRNGDSIHIMYGRDILVSQNNLTNNIGLFWHIMMMHSIDFIVESNFIGDNEFGGGILLSNCTSFTVHRNWLADVSNYGISLYKSQSNNIVGNRISKCVEVGLNLINSDSNRIFHNNFMGNSKDVQVSGINNSWDDGYPSGGNFWSDYTDMDSFRGPDQDVLGGDGVWDHAYVIDVNNTDHYPLVNPWVQQETLAVRGLDDRIYYRCQSGAAWQDWMVLPGSTVDSPATAMLGNQLHFVVCGSDGNSLWHGYLTNPEDPSSFSGWTLLSGATSSAPTLASNGTVLCLVVRGLDNRIYYHCYSRGYSWGVWHAVPSGATCDSPAAAMLGNDLHIVVRGMDGSSLWDTIVACNGTVIRGWSLLSGATPSKPVLAFSSADNLCLVVRGMDNTIYYRSYTGSTDSWADWNALPTGATSDGPGATVVGNELCTVVRGLDGSTLWWGDVDLVTSSFSGWTLLSGATPSAPELASTGTTPP